MVEEDSVLIHDARAVEQAIGRLANDINSRLNQQSIILLCVMTGGIVFTGMLLPRLNLSIRLDYIHINRYRDATQGGQLNWIKKPEVSLVDKTVLIVDDILDEGITLAAIMDYCKTAGASQLYSAVLVQKNTTPPIQVCADFVGLEAPNQYVYGFGMDYLGGRRNYAGIYALKDKV